MHREYQFTSDFFPFFRSVSFYFVSDSLCFMGNAEEIIILSDDDDDYLEMSCTEASVIIVETVEEKKTMKGNSTVHWIHCVKLEVRLTLLPAVCSRPRLVLGCFRRRPGRDLFPSC